MLGLTDKKKIMTIGWGAPKSRKTVGPLGIAPLNHRPRRHCISYSARFQGLKGSDCGKNWRIEYVVINFLHNASVGFFDVVMITLLRSCPSFMSASCLALEFFYYVRDLTRNPEIGKTLFGSWPIFRDLAEPLSSNLIWAFTG